MFVFDTSSWHYSLVLYVFGKTFFFNKKIDHTKIRNKMDVLEKKTRKKYPNNDDVIEKAINKNFRVWYEEEDSYTYTPKPVRFCPYCRAVLWSVILFPFATILKLIPKRKKKPFDIKKSKRNTNIIKVIAIVFFVIWGTYNLTQGNFIIAAFQYGVASFHWWNKYLIEYLAKRTAKREDKKIKQKSTTKLKNTNLFSAYLKIHHFKICPPVIFVDKNDTEVRR